MRERLDGGLREVLRVLREPAQLDRDFDARVMAAVRAVPAHRRPSFWSRVAEPRTITLRPRRWALLAASLVAALSLSAVFRSAAAPGADRLADSSDAPTAANQRRVQFVLVAPTAKKVAVVGDFNGWDRTHAAYRAHHQGGGVWAVTAAVPVGHHRYSFVVDDSVWVADPTAPRVLDDDYGVPNSAIVVEDNTP